MIRIDDGGMISRSVNITKLITGKLSGTSGEPSHGPDKKIPNGIEVLIKAPVTNQTDVLIGNSNTDFSSEGFPLSPGENLVITIKNLKELYYLVQNDADVLYYLIEQE